MEKSLLKFARDFEKLKSEYSSTDVPDQKITLLIKFWPRLNSYMGNEQFDSYFEEFAALLLEIITLNSISDMTIPELRNLRHLLDSIKEIESNANKALAIVTNVLASKCFYVGDINEGLNFFTDIYNENKRFALNLEGKYKSEFELFQYTCNEVKKTSTALFELLLPILVKWEQIRESIQTDHVNCLFVEKDEFNKTYRGRLKSLSGTIERFGKSAVTDEITFENMIVKPQDPFIGVAYDSLKAIRTIQKDTFETKKNNKYFHAHFWIKDSNQPITGDSIGLSIALFSYVNLIGQNDGRYSKYLASDVAFTGGIDPDGHVLPVNEESLKYKIERIFYSPLRYLVVPQANYNKASEILRNLRSDYPNRNLHIISTEHLTDVLENHNVIRPEKVCMGEFIAKKAYNYSRMIKIQIPILLILCYFLITLIYPRAWLWFDWKIDNLIVSTQQIKAINKNGNTLWTSNEFEQPLLAELYDKPENARNFYWAVDTDNDGKDELFFIPCHQNPTNKLYFFDSNGKIVWRKSTIRINDYTEDDYPHYQIPNLMPYIDESGDKFVITIIFSSPPARAQLNLFNAKGEYVSGPYIYPGALSLSKGMQIDLNKDGREEIILGGTNNWHDGIGMVVLDPKKMSGISPPYDNDSFRASNYPVGSQLYFVGLPETPLSADPEIRNSFRGISYSSTKKEYEIFIKEAYGLTVDGEQQIEENRPQFFYILDSNFIPKRAYAPDATRAFMNDLLLDIGREPIMNMPALCDSLKSEIVVYHGDKIVHHEAAGIFFKK